MVFTLLSSLFDIYAGYTLKPIIDCLSESYIAHFELITFTASFIKIQDILNSTHKTWKNH